MSISINKLNARGEKADLDPDPISLEKWHLKESKLLFLKRS